MDREHRTDTAASVDLVAASQIPRNRQTECCACSKDDGVAPQKLLAGHPATEWIVYMGVGASLIHQHVAVAEAFHQLGQTDQIVLGVSGGRVPAP